MEGAAPSWPESLANLPEVAGAGVVVDAGKMGAGAAEPSVAAASAEASHLPACSSTEPTGGASVGSEES